MSNRTKKTKAPPKSDKADNSNESIDSIDSNDSNNIKSAKKANKKPVKKKSSENESEEDVVLKKSGKKIINNVDKKINNKKSVKKKSSENESEEEIILKKSGKKTIDNVDKKISNKKSIPNKSLKSTKSNSKSSKSSNSSKIDNSLKADKSSKNKDNRILEITTTHTGAIKQVVERISGVISDCCIVFIPPDKDINADEDDDYFEEVDDQSKTKSKKNPNKKQPSKKNTGGIRILRLTEDKSILIKLNLEASKFDSFRCDEPKITIGVDMHNLHDHLKTINDDEPILFYMNRDNRSILYIRSLNENSGETDIEIFLMEIGNPDLPIPKTEFQNRITMASDKFHTICKHLNNNSTFVEITSIDNEISFKGQNEGGKVTRKYRDPNKKKSKDSGQIVQGVYDLRNLMGFSKCSKLCPTIDIYLKNDFPLVLVISVAILGKMYVFLSPIERDNNQ